MPGIPAVGVWHMEESPEYLKGKIEGLKRINISLFEVISRDLSTSDVVDLRVKVVNDIKEIIAELNAHPRFTSYPFGQGASDALSEFSAKLFP